MSIVESGSPRRNRRITRLEGLAGGALVAAAVFAASPSVHASTVYTNNSNTGGTSTDPNSSAAISWFNAANWVDSSGSTTGTLPESYSATANLIPNIIANNASMPSVGLVFDPKDDSLTPGGANANYVANILPTTLYVTSINGTVYAPSKLTIESGTINVGAGTITVGRDGAGIIAMNGGTLITGLTFKVQGVDTSNVTLIGSGTFEYHGGNLEAGGGVQLGTGMSATAGSPGLTSAGIGAFVVYNDGPAGAILSANGFTIGANSAAKGTVGIIEFHYDLNQGGVGGTRPIQDNWNNGQGTQGHLTINNSTNLSSRLNLVLDTSPGTVTSASNPSAFYQNLGLFDDTIISGTGTYPKYFYSVNGATVFTQGATISAVYGTSTYSWTISYSGQINFTNTAVSGYNSTGISATGGSDVVLIGITPLTVPEPSSMALLGGAGSLILARRRQKKGQSDLA
jgi:hypothetical protein